MAEVDADEALDAAAVSDAAAFVSDVAAAFAFCAVVTDAASISRMSPFELEKTMSSMRAAVFPPRKSDALLYAVRSLTTVPVASTIAISSFT